MSSLRLRWSLSSLVLIVLLQFLLGCNRSSVTSPSPLSESGYGGSKSTSSWTPAADFPPRNEPFDFRQQLESFYQGSLRRQSTSTFVDVEGDIVWTQEYLRYRVNRCDHSTAVQAVFDQIRSGTIRPVCGSAPAGSVAFPARDETFQFRQQLEAFYRDVLRRGASSTFVDLEGAIVWTQEYLRYRVNNCDHSTAVSKVLSQVSGNGIAPICAPPLPPAYIRFSGSPSNCTCAPTFFVKVDGLTVATASCAGRTDRLPVSPGQHTIEACSVVGTCATQVINLASGAEREYNFVSSCIRVSPSAEILEH